MVIIMTMSAAPSFRDLVVPAAEFKAKCLELMDRVRDQNITVTITKHGRPVACLKPVVERPRSIWGFAKSLIGDDPGDAGTAPVDADWGPDPAELPLYRKDWVAARRRGARQKKSGKSGRKRGKDSAR
jgi:prevent-host-death family protein